MLTISTISEALITLEKQTGRAWTESELLDLALNKGIELHAAAPLTATTTIHEYVRGEGMVEKYKSSPGDSPLARLPPHRVFQLLVVGETETKTTSGPECLEGQYLNFTEPVRVKHEHVRIKAKALAMLVDLWKKAQSGRWVKDPTQHSGMKRQNFPDWMYPPEIQNPAPTPKPLSRHSAQDQAILKVVKNLGYDPVRIPKNTSGKNGVKKEVRDALRHDKLFSGTTVFDKAWARLAASKTIELI